MDKTSVEICLPWPPKDCSPNARCHWGKKAKAAATYRRACFYDSLNQNIEAMRGPKTFRMAIQFAPPDKRARDDDNLIAMFKPGRDGLADALSVDDQHIKIGAIDIIKPERPGAVYVTLEAMEINAYE